MLYKEELFDTLESDTNNFSYNEINSDIVQLLTKIEIL